MVTQTVVENTCSIVTGSIIPHVLEDRVLRFHFLVQGNVEVAHIGNIVRSTGELRVVTKSVDTIIREEVGCFLWHSLTCQSPKHSAICVGKTTPSDTSYRRNGHTILVCHVEQGSWNTAKWHRPVSPMVNVAPHREHF